MQVKLNLVVGAVAALLSGVAMSQDLVVKIGHVGPTSGAIAHLGKDNELGARLAIEELNAKGVTIGGKKAKFELLAEDDAGDPKQGTAAAQKLVDSKVNGVEAGAAALAAAGLLDGQRACADWTLLDSLADSHPAVAWAAGLWEIAPDGSRLSCAAGTASLDLCCAWLASLHGERVGQELVQALGLRGLRPRDERQRAGYSEQRGAGSAKLAEALTLMEANLAEPLPTEEVARLVGVSRRQLERLFKQHLDTLPSRHYLELRLARAQRLLQQSSQSILQIGLSCGFSSGPHFSNAYKAHFGHTPRDERSRRALAWRAGGPTGDLP